MSPKVVLIGHLTCVGLLGLGLVILIAPVVSHPAWSTETKGDTLQAGTGGKPTAPLPPPSALVKTEDWQKTPFEPITPGEIDRLVEREFAALAERDAKAARFKPAPKIDDEQFIRRVMIDVCGRLPTADEVSGFVSDGDSKKRELLIDRLLESDDYAAHWARYWSDVISVRVSIYMRRNAHIFEEWLFEQLKANKGWGEIVKAIITADAVLSDTARWPNKNASFEERAPQVAKDGATFFVSTHYYEKTRPEAAVDLAAETARVFLGIQLQCAQCHDHPREQWKRVQFHQLAAYFARSGGRPRPQGKGAVGNWTQVYYPEGEYEMPDQYETDKVFITHPAFLDGKAPAENLTDQERRASIASQLIDKQNYWFAAAFVNRIWGELMGQAFSQPVDDMGPQKSAVFRSVQTRLTGAFRATDYDIKSLLRALLNTETYQRQFRLGESADEHLNFTAASPRQMQPGVLWKTIETVFAAEPAAAAEKDASAESAATKPSRVFAQPMGQEADFLAEFDYDLSLKPEKSLTQVLVMMNSYLVNGRIPAYGNNLLVRVLRDYPDDNEALRALYLKVLARRPTDKEMTICQKYIAETGKRAPAFEDILWSLLNSPEFQIKR